MRFWNDDLLHKNPQWQLSIRGIIFCLYPDFFPLWLTEQQVREREAPATKFLAAEKMPSRFRFRAVNADPTFPKAYSGAPLRTPISKVPCADFPSWKPVLSLARRGTTGRERKRIIRAILIFTYQISILLFWCFLSIFRGCKCYWQEHDSWNRIIGWIFN